ncbi:ABC-three component system middle component 2 [Aquimarina agarilytica]|uniref:ABC-three component system middle component 2 n=1 Tax=Aquimarina agarilytica TaxID=1087449 RepID=UPI0002887B1B|nr:ABC-three component system middle component 2 [Aquimarina agarilytica]
MELLKNRNTKVFNSPLEMGLRTLFLLSACNKPCDLQRLVYYDYILLHSGDIPTGPISIHPNIPFRASEILVKRELIKKGLNLILSRDLVKLNFSDNGFTYESNELTAPFLKYLDTPYANDLLRTSSWVVDYFGNLSDSELELYFKDKLDVWGGEFTKESFLRGNTTI